MSNRSKAEADYIELALERHGQLGLPEARRAFAGPAVINVADLPVRPGGYRLDPQTGAVGDARIDLASRWKHTSLIALLGEAEMGKSVALKYMLREGATWHRPGNDRVPFLVSFQDCHSANSVSSLVDLVWDLLDSRWKSKSIRTVLDRASDEGRADFLLDDFDDLGARERRQVIELISRYLASHVASGSRVVLASRIASYVDVRPRPPRGEEYLLQELTDEDIARLVSAFATAILDDQAVAHRWSGDFIARVLGDVDLRAMVGVPGLLAVAVSCALVEGPVLSAPKAVLLDEMTWSLAQARRRGDSPTSPHALDALTQVAFSVTQQDPYGLEFHADELGTLTAGTTRGVVDELSGSVIQRTRRAWYKFTAPAVRDHLASRAVAERMIRADSGQPWLERVGAETQAAVAGLTLGTTTDLRARLDLAEDALRQLLVLDGDSSRLARAARAVRRAGSRELGSSMRASLDEGLRMTVTDRSLAPSDRVEAAALLSAVGKDRVELASPVDQLVDFMPSGHVYLHAAHTEPRWVSLDIWLGRHPVTMLQFRQFAESGGYETPAFWSPKGWEWRQEERVDRPPLLAGRFQVGTQPAVGVTCYEAEAYCAWLEATLSQEIGPRHWVVTLPTETEWISAARGTLVLPRVDAASSLGEVWASAHDVARRMTVQNVAPLRKFSWEHSDERTPWLLADSCLEAPPPVGTFPELAGPFGSQELSGSVWQWLATAWGPNWNTPSVALGDDAHADLTDGARDEPRMVRGGSYLVRSGEGASEHEYHLKVDYRARNYPDIRHTTHGFRVCLRSRRLQ